MAPRINWPQPVPIIVTNIILRPQGQTWLTQIDGEQYVYSGNNLPQSPGGAPGPVWLGDPVAMFTITQDTDDPTLWHVDASESTPGGWGGTAITLVEWWFGEGGNVYGDGGGPTYIYAGDPPPMTADYQYFSPGYYPITLRISSGGRTAVTTQVLQVS